MPEDISCPICGSEMVVRTAKKGPPDGHRFYVCIYYPECKGKVQIREQTNDNEWVTDHRWHTIEYQDLPEWVRSRVEELDYYELIGSSFIYRLNPDTGNYQRRLLYRQPLQGRLSPVWKGIIICIALVAAIVIIPIVTYSVTYSPNQVSLYDWTEMISGTNDRVWGVWGTSSSDVFAVGNYGTILHYDGSTWSEMSSGTTEYLCSVWGISHSSIFAVGNNGIVLHYDGIQWNAVNSGTPHALRCVWGTSPNDVFAVGDYGTILHYDGSTWSIMEQYTQKWLYGVWGTPSSDIFAVGKYGTILYYDGNAEGTWSPMTSGTT